MLMGLFDSIVSHVTDREYVKCVASVLLCGILLNNSYQIYTWPELHTAAGECVATAKKLGVNNECIYVVKAAWRSFTIYQELIQYQNMTFISERDPELLYTDDYAGYDHVVMYFDKDTNPEIIDEILTKMIEMNPGLNSYEKLHEYSYSMAYYLE